MRKIFLSFLAILIFSISTIIPIKQVEAAAPVLLRVVGGSVGERIIISTAEKAGVKFGSKKAQQEAVQRWNLEIYEKIKDAEKFGREHEAEQLRKWQQIIHQTTPEGLQVVDGGKNAGKGFGKIVVSTALFLTGLDIILDTVDSIETAVANEEMLTILEEYNEQISNGEGVVQHGPYTMFVVTFDRSSNKSEWHDQVYWGSEQAYNAWINGGANALLHHFEYIVDSAIGTGAMMMATDINGSSYKLKYTIKTRNDPNTIQTGTDSVTLAGPEHLKQNMPIEIPDYTEVNWQPTIGNIPSVPSVPWVSPWRDDPDTNKPVLPDEGIPLEVPLTDPDTYSPDEPWNDPLPTYDPVPGDQPDKDYIPGVPINPNPDPGTNPNPDTGGDTNPDTGGDTNPDPGGETNPDPGSQPEPGGETNPNPDPGTGNPGTPGTEPPTEVPGGPPKPTDPLSWIWIFITFLFAVIKFILRLGSFIMTIPFIPAQQFPGVYGEMVSTFMNLKYGNIYPYKIMISFANLAFGFVVYKILRRVFNG